MYKKYIQLSLLMVCLGVVLVPSQADALIQRKCTEEQIDACADKLLDCLGKEPFNSDKKACRKLSEVCCALCGGCR
jgi:hypothetical protein